MKGVISKFIMFVLIVLVFGILMAFPVMWLWNSCLIPAVNGINPIGFWQAWGIMVLANILFKSHYDNNKK